jgi:tetratricopeptide (TPR) repeat protein
MPGKDNYIKKATKLYQEGKYEDSIYWFSRAISVDGKNPEIYAERAVAYFHFGDLNKSLDDLNTAQELEPERPYRYSSRAYIKDAMGDVEGAIKDYEKAIELDPEDAVAHNNLGLLEEKLGHTKKAKVLYDFADNLAKDQFGDQEIKRPENIQSKINKEKSETSLSNEMKKALTTKKGFSEFLTFIRNGFK